MCDISTAPYITLTVQNGEDIELSFIAKGGNAPVKIVSGTKEYNIIAESTDDYYYATCNAGASTMTIYGDILKFVCSSNGNRVTGLDASHNTDLTEIYCNGNQLTELNVSQNTALEWLSCYGNQLTSLDVSQNTALTELLQV